MYVLWFQKVLVLRPLESSWRVWTTVGQSLALHMLSWAMACCVDVLRMTALVNSSHASLSHIRDSSQHQACTRVLQQPCRQNDDTAFRVLFEACCRLLSGSRPPCDGRFPCCLAPWRQSRISLTCFSSRRGLPWSTVASSRSMS